MSVIDLRPQIEARTAAFWAAEEELRLAPIRKQYDAAMAGWSRLPKPKVVVAPEIEPHRDGIDYTLDDLGRREAHEEDRFDEMRREPVDPDYVSADFKEVAIKYGHWEAV
jgi:hypothetical protein